MNRLRVILRRLRSKWSHRDRSYCDDWIARRAAPGPSSSCVKNYLMRYARTLSLNKLTQIFVTCCHCGLIQDFYRWCASMGTHPPRYWNRYIKYEVVHEVCGWNDLRRRLQSNCRCFAFFHPVISRALLILLGLRWSMRWRRGLGRDSTPASPRVMRNALKPPFFIPSAIVSQVCAAYRGAIF